MKIKIAYAKSEKEVIVRIIEINPDEMVSSLKEKIQSNLHIPTEEQVLFFGDRRLEDHGKLNDYNIIADDSNIIIQLTTKSQLEKSGGQSMPLEKKSITNKSRTDNEDEPITIYIQNPGQRTQALTCKLTDKVSTLQQEYQVQTGIPITDVGLRVQGQKQILEPENLLSDCEGILPGCTIQLMRGCVLEAKPIRIYINLNGQKEELSCNSTDKVSTLRKEYEKRTGVSITDVILKIQDQIPPLTLHEDDSLSANFIVDGCTLEKDLKKKIPLSKQDGSSTSPTTQTQKSIEELKRTKPGDVPLVHGASKDKIPLSSEIGFWLAGKHTKKTITVGTGAGAGLGYLYLQENMGLLSLAVGAGAGFFITLIVEGLIKCAIPQGQWKTMQEQESQSSVVGSQT